MIMAVESGQDGVFGVRKLVWWLPAWQLSHSPNNHLLVRNPPRNKLRIDSFLDFPTIECGIFLVTLLNFDHLIKVTVAFSLGPPTEWAESLSGIVLCILYVTDSRSKKVFCSTGPLLPFPSLFLNRKSYSRDGHLYCPHCHRARLPDGQDQGEALKKL